MRVAALAGAATLLIPAAADASALLDRHAPAYRHDAAETHPVRSVYGRVVRAGGRTWLQYWSYHAYNSQDRGILRTGRHEGDWELVQLRFEGGRPTRATYAQHSWAESCPWGGGRPDVFVANGSHAALFEAGTSDRPWPDPNDEADGRGRRAQPRVRTGDAVLRRPGRWGRSRAGWVPGEQSSPVGPYFQAGRWNPVAFEASARPCGSGPPGRPWATALAVALVTIALLPAWRRTRRGTL